MTTRPLRFCMITTFYPPYNFGGDGIFVRQLSHELAQRGHQVEVSHCIDAYRVFARQEPTGAYDDHPNVTVHGLQGPFGRFSPLATQQTGFPAEMDARSSPAALPCSDWRNRRAARSVAMIETVQHPTFKREDFDPAKSGISAMVRLRNEEDSAAAALEFIQLFFDEFVIVYNQCTDRTPEIVEEFAGSRIARDSAIAEMIGSPISTGLSETTGLDAEDARQVEERLRGLEYLA